MQNLMDSLSVENQPKDNQMGSSVELQDKEFAQFRDLIFRIAGISLSAAKKQLVATRLIKRLKFNKLTNYGDYFRLISAPHGKAELQLAVDALTTNETHFFREHKHFDFLRAHVIPKRKMGKGLRIWSAACSSGEEPYSIAMMLDELLGSEPWEVIASDISTHVLEKANKGLYSAERIPEIPQHYLSRYCLKGIGQDQGTMMIKQSLRDRVRFIQHNLTETPAKLGEFDMIFLRNVLIYFNQETQSKVVSRLLPLLRPGGYFLIGHSETLNGITTNLQQVMPATYRKPV